jgi:hypothetical protein
MVIWTGKDLDTPVEVPEPAPPVRPKKPPTKRTE